MPEQGMAVKLLFLPIQNALMVIVRATFHSLSVSFQITVMHPLGDQNNYRKFYLYL